MDTETSGPEETFALGRKMGLAAKAGDIICLDGELGAGKTVFAKGFADGIGVKEPVASPTFTILQIYDGGRLPLYHFDVYRIEEPEEMEETGYEEFFYGDGVCLIEWAQLIDCLIPEEAVHINIEKVPEGGFDHRRIRVE